jgi:hypothetical protein
MNETTTNRELDWAAVEGALPVGWRELAVQRKLVRPNLPAHMNAKVSDIGQVLRLVLYQVARSTALLSAVAAFSAAGLVSMSAVALHKWMKKIGPYLAELVSAMVEHAHAVFAPERWAGLEIIAVDATCVQRPGACGTTARVHRALRLTDLRVVQVQVTDNTGGESFRRFRAEPGQLWMGDRGYANPPGVGAIHAQGALVLVRYNRGSLPLFDARGRALDVQAKLRHIGKAGRCREWEAFVHPPQAARIRGRLCAVRLPSDKAQQARERLRREQGASVTQQSLAMAEFVAVFTTVVDSRLNCEKILELYSLRWQLELDFKRDKSITGLDQLPNFLPETIHSWICAKLLLHQIVRKLSTPQASFPPSAIVRAISPAPQRRAA